MAENRIKADFSKEVGSSRRVTRCTSFRADIKTTTRKYPKRSSLNENDFLNLLHGSDPVKVELDRLQNALKEKDHELANARNEVKALRLAERVKEKALTEVTEELEKMIKKFQACEASVENKNLEIKRISDEKKAALTAQFTAEASLRRVHAAQKDEELPPLDAILAPLESEIKILKQEVSKLQDDNKSLDRMTKAKEAALLGAERDVKLANIKASLVEDLQNRNQELVRQVEISQEEYEILDKLHRQKIGESEKLRQTIRELKESLISGHAAANAIHDYKRQVSELKGEKKTLERTLSRAKVEENRVALVVANEGKDSNARVMPIKQWQEDRRLVMVEMQHLQDKLSIAESCAKSEAKLKEKLQLRLKVLEESLQGSPHPGAKPSEIRNSSKEIAKCRSMGRGEYFSRFLPTGDSKKKTTPPLRTPDTVCKNGKGVPKMFNRRRSLSQDNVSTECFGDLNIGENSPSMTNFTSVEMENDSLDIKQSAPSETLASDSVPAVFYNLIQKEIISLRKTSQEKKQDLKDKDMAIEVLTTKVDTLAKAMEAESKKMRKEKSATQKELAVGRINKEQNKTYKSLSGSNGTGNHLRTLNGRK